MPPSDALVDFLHSAHIFASTVRDVLEEKCLRQAADEDLNLPQFSLLRLIANNGGPQVRGMASLLGVSQAAVSKNVDKLVRLGLVARQVQESDRRAVSLSVTPRGTELMRRYEERKRETLEDVLEHFSPDELQRLTRGLGELSYLILQKEQDPREICMRCSAYQVDECPLRAASNGCIYAPAGDYDRKHATAG